MYGEEEEEREERKEEGRFFDGGGGNEWAIDGLGMVWNPGLGGG